MVIDKSSFSDFDIKHTPHRHILQLSFLLFMYLDSILLLSGICFIIFINQNFFNQFITSKAHISTQKVSIIPTKLNNQYIVTIPFSSTLQKIDKNLNLMATHLPGESPADQVTQRNVVYYSAGLIPTGNYKGFYRIIAIADPLGPSDPEALMFTTKDGKSFTVDGYPDSVTNYNGNIGNSQFSDYSRSVTNSNYLSEDFPQQITLDSQFSLLKQDIYFEKDPSSTNAITKYILPKDYTKYTLLKSTLPGLKLYAMPKGILPPSSSGYSEPNINAGSIADQFIETTTQVIAVNEDGLGYIYRIAPTSTVTTYVANLPSILHSQQIYNEKVTPNVAYPTLSPPLLAFKKSDIQSKAALYSIYETAYPGICSGGGENALVLKNVQESNFTKIGTANGMALYTIKDSNSPLLKQEYNVKVASYQNAFQSLNKISPPPYNTYISQNPLLVFKDSFGRWVLLGEFQYLLPGGCGKPAIYLYSPKPIKVNLQFAQKINLDINIPVYHGGWNVGVNASGTIQDLQPQFTNCSLLDTKRIGSEYAKSACLNNEYPYIYWSGNSPYSKYPEITSGWYVKKEDLSTFMNQKLDLIGFSTKEKNDMMTYWLPRMLQANKSYYRISFLQTSAMNTIAPMVIKPQPDSFYRIFLDYFPLDKKPIQLIQSEKLQKIKRVGFTYIEWGGLERD